MDAALRALAALLVALDTPAVFNPCACKVRLSVGSLTDARSCLMADKLVSGASLPSSTYSIVHKDGALLVVDKDAGLLTKPGKTADKADSLLSRLQAGGHPEVKHEAHRLDRDTSGLIVFGRTPGAHRALSIAFQERQVTKRYEALAVGWIEDDEGRVDAPIGKVMLEGAANSVMRVVQKSAPGARSSVTDWRVIERGKLDDGTPFSHIHLFPITGRSHQLRVHLAHIGHPLLGDQLHSGAGINGTEAANAWPCLCLHAASLSFAHPVSGKMVQFESVAPFMNLLGNVSRT